jgi:hypothetical protein
MIPRISSDALPPILAEKLRPRIERLGYLGEFFRCAAHQPEALTSFMAFTEDLKRALPERIAEVVALTVSTELANAYERHQHEQLCLKLGFGEQWVRRVESLDGGARTTPPAPDALSDDERCVQALTVAVLRRGGHRTAPELEQVVLALGHQSAIAVLMLIGRYVTHALMVNALELEPPVPSPFAFPIG